jgi:hypothetical protein
VKLACLVFAITMMAAAPLRAQTSCGNGCLPEELVESGRAFEESIESEDHRTLRRLQLLGNLCVEYDCGSNPALTEEQASKLFDLHDIEEKEKLLKNEQWWSALWSWIATIVGLAFAAGSLLVSYLALKQSNQNEKEIGQLQGQIDSSKGET